MSKTILITGASRGFGKIWAKAFLKRGDNVIATARNVKDINNNQDEYSKDIIITHIDSILRYAQRFYKRQFLNRNVFSRTIISRFTEILKIYLENGKLQKDGLPTVKYMAAQLSITPRYLSDLLKQETGKTALEHIHIFLIDEAKNLLMSTNNTIAETAYQLGFDNPPYFSRLFKKEVGLTPVEYKEQKTGLS